MPSSNQPARPRVSVVICTRDRHDKIRQAVSSVLAVEHDGFDLTVIDQSTSDDTRRAIADLLEQDTRLRYVHTAEAGLSRAYNLGISSTCGELLAFTDDDCIVPADWLSSIEAAFDVDEEADLLYGQVVPALRDLDSMRLTPQLLIERPERLSRRDGFRIFGMGANFAARRRLFERIGPFDEILGGGGPLKSSQDFDLAYRTYRSGSVIALRPEVVVRHDGRREQEDWPALLRNYGIGDGAFYSKHVRCRDPFALWLMVRQFSRSAAKCFWRWILRRTPRGRPYLTGMIVGTKNGLRYRVDRDSRLYTVR